MINMTGEDLSANQQGVISHRQRTALKKQRLVWLMGTVSLILLLTLALLLVLLKLQDQSFAARGELLLALPIGLLWLWLLGSSPLLWIRAGRDLRDGHAASQEGRAYSKIRGGVGIIQASKYYLCIGERCFRLSQDVFLHFRPGESYRIYYAPASNQFFGGLPLSEHLENYAAIKEGTEFADLLTNQERMILQLIAEGRSNKEIARHLSLSVNTIKMYTSQIYRKLGVSRRTEAVAYARELNLL